METTQAETGGMGVARCAVIYEIGRANHRQQCHVTGFKSSPSTVFREETEPPQRYKVNFNNLFKVKTTAEYSSPRS
jgi:hypothetical protein